MKYRKSWCTKVYPSNLITPQYGFWTFTFPLQALLDLMSRSWYHPIPQKDLEKKVGGRAGFVCVQLSPCSPRSSEAGAAHSPGTQHCCQCSMHCPSVQLLRPWGTPALVPAQSSPSPTFLLENGEYNINKFISALSSYTLHPQCSPALDFPQTLGLWTGVKSFS